MIKKQFVAFLVRWIISSIAMYICINFFGGFKEGSAGLIFSLVNTVVKPIATIFALPLIFVTLGLFTLILNAAMVGLTILLIPGVTMSFWGAIESCLLISFINFLVNIGMPSVK